MLQPSQDTPEPFTVDEAVVPDRVRRRLAAVLRQLDRRIAELELALESLRLLEGELSAERLRVAQLEAELEAARTDLEAARTDALAITLERDGLRRELTDLRDQHDRLLATKTFRLLAAPRRIYGLALRARHLHRD